MAYKYNITSDEKSPQSSDKKEETTTQNPKMRRHPMNLIFYGPPGTGKTYHMIDRAVALLGMQQETHLQNHYLFRQLLGDRIEFVSFHENYTYEDFVEGIKPDVNRQTGNLIYGLREGVFKRIALRAMDNFRRATDINFQRKEQAFLYGIRKLLTPLEKEEAEEIPIPMGQNTFFLTGYNPNSIKARFGKIGMPSDLSVQILRRLYLESRKYHELFLGMEPNPYYDAVIDLLVENESHIPEEALKPVPALPYVLIIDEINRAPLAKVLGELVTLIEEDKRYGCANFLTATLPISGFEFAVPANLYILGSMNRTDKTLFPIEAGLRRRFEFEYIPPRLELVHEPYREIFEKLNNILLLLLGPDFMLGHSFFINNEQSIESIMNLSIIPLLYEYFQGNNDQVRKVLDATGVKYELYYGIWRVIS